MTAKEAQEIIGRKSSIPNEGESYEYISEAYDEYISEAYDRAIIALGNQIKKKVKFWQGQTVCPRCGRLFGNSKDISSVYKHHNSYCRYCGQALDWSEEE